MNIYLKRCELEAEYAIKYQKLVDDVRRIKHDIYKYRIQLADSEISPEQKQEWGKVYVHQILEDRKKGLEYFAFVQEFGEKMQNLVAEDPQFRKRLVQIKDKAKDKLGVVPDSGTADNTDTDSEVV
jgi:Na+/phosphate symporter